MSQIQFELSKHKNILTGQAIVSAILAGFVIYMGREFLDFWVVPAWIFLISGVITAMYSLGAFIRLITGTFEKVECPYCDTKNEIVMPLRAFECSECKKTVVLKNNKWSKSDH